MYAALAPESLESTKPDIYFTVLYIYFMMRYSTGLLLQHVRGERGEVELLCEGDGDDDALLLGRGQRRTRHLLRHLQVRVPVKTTP